MKKNNEGILVGMVTGICIMCILFVICSQVWLHAKKEAEAEARYEIAYSVYQIKDGDTAYAISETNKRPGMDSREYIELLGETNNNLDFFHVKLITGNYILVPTYVEK